MKKLFLVILALIAVPMFITALVGTPAGSAAPATPAAATAASAAPKPDPAADAAFERLKFAAVGVQELQAAMRNPGSFQLAQILEMPKGAMCYEYRAQNGFGGMNVEHAVMLDKRLKAQGSSGYEAAWNKNCAGKTGHDVTDKVQEIINFAKANS